MKGVFTMKFLKIWLLITAGSFITQWIRTPAPYLVILYGQDLSATLEFTALELVTAVLLSIVPALLITISLKKLI